MRVEFYYTQEDLIDASKRFLARSRVTASWRWQGLGYTALFTGVVVFSLFTYASGRPGISALIAIVAAALSALAYPSSHRNTLERRLRKLCQEQLGDADRFLCEVEVTAAGLLVKQLNRQTLIEWPGVKEIQETSDSVDIFTRDGGGVIVRSRAFETAADKERFLELVRASINAAHSS